MMIRDITGVASPVTVVATPTRLESAHEVVAGHCTACDATLAAGARAVAGSTNPAIFGALAATGSRSPDRVSLSPTARAAALRGTLSASQQSRTKDEVERTLDVESVDPEFQRGRTATIKTQGATPNAPQGRQGTDPTQVLASLDAARGARLRTAVTQLADLLDNAKSPTEAEQGVETFVGKLDPQTRKDLQSLVETLGRNESNGQNTPETEVPASTDATPGATDGAGPPAASTEPTASAPSQGPPPEPPTSAAAPGPSGGQPTAPTTAASQTAQTLTAPAAGTPKSEAATPAAPDKAGGKPAAKAAAPTEAEPKAAKAPQAGGVKTADQLTPDQRREVNLLQARDREVRAHEAAHQAVAGANGGSASFSFQTGPDGRQYAIGGEVPIDMSTVRNDPSATFAKMEQVRRAALAPADPSSQDRSVAAQATHLADLAQREAREKQVAAAAERRAQQQSERKTEAAAVEAQRNSKTDATGNGPAQTKPGSDPSGAPPVSPTVAKAPEASQASTDRTGPRSPQVAGQGTPRPGGLVQVPSAAPRGRTPNAAVDIIA